MSDRETAYLIRSMVSRGVVGKSDDSQETQTVDVAQWAGVDRTGVEVLQPFGVASHAPENGLVLLLAVGGDQGDLVALPVGAPGSRLGNLAEGEVALYTTDGSRVLIRADGAIEVTSSKSVDVKVPGARLEVRGTFVRGRMEGGERFVAAPGYAKLAAAGHFIAVSGAGVTASVPVIIGAEPGAGT